MCQKLRGSFEAGRGSGVFCEGTCSFSVGISIFLEVLSGDQLAQGLSNFYFCLLFDQNFQQSSDSKAGTSATILSVSTSSRVSPRSKLSPSERFQVTTIPSSIVSPSRGSLSSLSFFSHQLKDILFDAFTHGTDAASKAGDTGIGISSQPCEGRVPPGTQSFLP